MITSLKKKHEETNPGGDQTQDHEQAEQLHTEIERPHNVEVAFKKLKPAVRTYSAGEKSRVIGLYIEWHKEVLAKFLSDGGNENNREVSPHRIYNLLTIIYYFSCYHTNNIFS